MDRSADEAGPRRESSGSTAVKRVRKKETPPAERDRSHRVSYTCVLESPHARISVHSCKFYRAAATSLRAFLTASTTYTATPTLQVSVRHLLIRRHEAVAQGQDSVLVADDNNIIQAVFTRHLAETYELVLAESAKEVKRRRVAVKVFDNWKMGTLQFPVLASSEASTAVAWRVQQYYVA